MSITEDGDQLEHASFWELKSYMRTVKRVENANKLTADLSQLIIERAAIESAYAENLKKWSNKWHTLISTGIEYGTGAHPWFAICEESSMISQMHKSVAETLSAEIQPSVKRWTKDQFHKSSVQGLKEAKNFEHDFELAQKPWAKKIKKVSQCKKDYYMACKALRSLKVQAENAHSDPSGTPDQLKKIQEKTRKAEADEAKTLDAYKNALHELEQDKSRYMADMQRVFQRSQDFEINRLQFFKQTFVSLFETLDLTKKAQIPGIYSTLISRINKATPKEDLQIWSQNHGIDMFFPEIAFEEYQPELLAISKKKMHSVSDGNAPGVTLTNMTSITSPNRGIEQNNTNSYPGYGTDPAEATNGHSVKRTDSIAASAPVSDKRQDHFKNSSLNRAPQVYNPSLNPFSEYDDDDYEDVEDVENLSLSSNDESMATSQLKNVVASSNSDIEAPLQKALSVQKIKPQIHDFRREKFASPVIEARVKRQATLNPFDGLSEDEESEEHGIRKL